MKASELKDQPQEELEAIIDDLKSERYELVNELKLSKKLQKPHLIRQKRREIARIKTVLRQKKGSKDAEK